jgi:hypothetical protein
VSGATGATDPAGFVDVVVGDVVVVDVVVVEFANEVDDVISADPRPKTSARANERRIGKKLQRATTQGVTSSTILTSVARGRA